MTSSPIARDTHPKHDVALGATLLSPSRKLVAATPLTGGEPIHDQVRQRSAVGRPRVLLAAASLAVVALAGLSWLLLGSARSTAVGAEQVGVPVAETTRDGITSASSPTETASAPAADPSAPATTQEAVTSSSNTKDPAPASSSPTLVNPHPASLDSVSAHFLTAVCAAQADMNIWLVQAGTGFPSVTENQDAYVRAYAGRAAAARRAVATLEGMLPATIADGRVDGAGIVTNMRSRAQIWEAGALTLRSLQPRTTNDLDTAAAVVNQNIADIPLSDMSGLTGVELEWMRTLPGCEVL